MKRFIILALLALVFASVSAVQAQQSQAPSKATTQSSVPAINPQAAASCSACFTCGGDWPIFVGGWASPLPSSGNNVTERGSGCANPLTGRRDSFPFLCCN
jgi:hypothetical protein